MADQFEGQKRVTCALITVLPVTGMGASQLLLETYVNYRQWDTFNEDTSSMDRDTPRQQNTEYLLRWELQKSQQWRTISSARRLREQVEKTSLN